MQRIDSPVSSATVCAIHTADDEANHSATGTLLPHRTGHTTTAHTARNFHAD